VSALPAYVVVTPARNEVRFIEQTLLSMIGQRVRPLKWVIVSDGSTDGTDELVERYHAQHPWIELLRMPERRERHFAGKAYAVRAGVEAMADLPFAALACLDADITFAPDYFEILLTRLAGEASLGLIGTPFVETTQEVYDYRYVNIEHVDGACQLFRRACWEEIGGYFAVKGGAIDTIACIHARMKGWKTRCYTEQHCFHHRAMGTAEQNPLRARYVIGCRDYMMGNLPLWEFARVLYQMTKKPYLLRGAALAWGYLHSWGMRSDRPVSAEFVQFVRAEQWGRLKRALRVTR